jgi:hypothetical protein
LTLLSSVLEIFSISSQMSGPFAFFMNELQCQLLWEFNFISLSSSIFLVIYFIMLIIIGDHIVCSFNFFNLSKLIILWRKKSASLKQSGISNTFHRA